MQGSAGLGSPEHGGGEVARIKGPGIVQVKNAVQQGMEAHGGVGVLEVASCQPVAWADIKAGAEAKQVDWADVVDFYARHSCDEYTFFRGYKFAASELPRLPVPPRR